MSCISTKLLKHIAGPTSTLVCRAQGSPKLWYSRIAFDVDSDEERSEGVDDVHDDFIPDKREALPQGVDPRKGWNFRGVHKAIICGKVRQTPVQRLLKTGKPLTIFKVGTGGMWDQRDVAEKNAAKFVQLHRVVVHNETLGAYAVQHLIKNSLVYVEGDIELRVYYRGITSPEICVHNNGSIRLIKTGESATSFPFEELSEGLL